MFDYQAELVERILDRLEVGGRSLLSLPTGAGKTRTVVAAVLEGMTVGGVSRAAWLAPTRELVEQATETFQTLWHRHGEAPNLTLRLDGGVSGDGCEVVLQTVQSVYADARRGRELGEFDIVVFDEAHRLGASTFREGLWHAMGEGGGRGARATLIGLSATPGRVDRKETEDLVKLFGGQLLMSERLKPNPIRVLQRRGVLARLMFRRLTEKNIPTNDEGSRTVVAGKACEELVRRGGRVLVFTASVPGAVVLAEALESKGVGAGFLHGGVSAEKRRGVLEAFEAGDISVLTNQRILSTGYDCPAVSDVVLVGRIGSPVLFEQTVGRGARGPRTGGFSKATIWDFDDHLDIHGLPSSYYRYNDFDWEYR